MNPEPHKREVVFPVECVRSGDPKKDEITLRGHAAVFNSLSEDLGGFREKIEPGFFRDALKRKPDVRLLINHDGLPLARTASGTLELREDDRGLHVFARLDGADPDVETLRRKMQRGDVDQMSFAFTLRDDGDDWDVSDDGAVTRTLRADGADELFDVSVVTFPAYRATAVSMRSVLEDAISRGRVPVSVEQALVLTESSEVDVAERGVDEPEVALSSANAPAVGEERDVAPESEVVDGADETAVEGVAGEEVDLVAELQESTRARRDEMAESYLRLLKEHGLPT